MLRLIIYGLIIYFGGKWAWEWIQKNISIQNQDESIKGRPRSELDIDIDNNEVEDVKYTEIDDEED